jgi:hypothetical protein
VYVSRSWEGVFVRQGGLAAPMPVDAILIPAQAEV